MAKRTKPPEKRDAILSFQEMDAAIRKIDRRIKDLEDFDIHTVNSRSDPQINALEISMKDLLIDVFGSDSTQYDNYRTITNLDRAGINVMYETPLHEVREGLERGKGQAKAILETIKRGFIEKLEDAGHTSEVMPIKAYEGLDLHPEIDRQVGQLFRDGHHTEAVEKSVKVLNSLVRMRSGEEIDGTALMQKVFSPKNPIIKFNTLSDQSDYDEQMGFMFLFSGAVMGLRNPRAHKLIQDDPERALEFIAFVSLLAKLLDEGNT